MPSKCIRQDFLYMIVKNLVLSFLLLTIFVFVTPSAFAQEKASNTSASFSSILEDKASDNRAKVLQAYLENRNSPLAPYAQAFVKNADMYNLDWRLVAAISGVESTFGQAQPEDCNNSWGYGIYGDNRMCFYSYYEAIRTISGALREKYMDQWGATDVYSIGHLYAASPTWAERVAYFMEDMDEYRLRNANQPLSISL